MRMIHGRDVSLLPDGDSSFGTGYWHGADHVRRQHGRKLLATSARANSVDAGAEPVRSTHQWNVLRATSGDTFGGKDTGERARFVDTTGRVGFGDDAGNLLVDLGRSFGGGLEFDYDHGRRRCDSRFQSVTVTRTQTARRQAPSLTDRHDGADLDDRFAILDIRLDIRRDDRLKRHGQRNVGVTAVTWSTNIGRSGTATGTLSGAPTVPLLVGSNSDDRESSGRRGEHRLADAGGHAPLNHDR